MNSIKGEMVSATDEKFKLSLIGIVIASSVMSGCGGGGWK